MKTTDSSPLRREISVRQLVTLVALLYSVAVIATLAPPVARLTPSLLLLIYYLLVPGYCVTLLFGESYDFIQKLLFTIFISVALSVSLLGVNHVSGSFDIPLEISLPAISIGIIIYGYYFHRL